MKCAEIHPNLAAFVVGGLEPKEAAEVEDHLASCPGCTNELRVAEWEPEAGAADLVGKGTGDA
jgi:anti-sigma factor RsiW